MLYHSDFNRITETRRDKLQVSLLVVSWNIPPGQGDDYNPDFIKTGIRLTGESGSLLRRSILPNCLANMRMCSD